MATYQHILNKFHDLKVLVIGEMMLDCYFKGTSQRLSREAPVPIVDLKEKVDVPGGAANTALNVAALGAQTFFLSAGGDDYEGNKIRMQLSEKNVDVKGVYFENKRETMTKKRIISDDQLLLRYDNGSMGRISKDTEIRIIHYLDQKFKLFDVIILSDYDYGIFTDNIIRLIASLQDKYHKVLILDSKKLSRFKQIELTAVKPNYEQVVELLNIQPVQEHRVDQILQHGTDIFDHVHTRIAACTIDIDGCVVYERHAKPTIVPTTPMPNANASGAGDTFVSALSLALGAGAPTPEAAMIASAASSVVVQRDGTTQCSFHELEKKLTPHKKIVYNIDDLQLLVHLYRKEQKKILFTNGCFDIIHSGHISFLKEAKTMGDILIVGLNDDASVKEVTGYFPEHPIEKRIEVLKQLNIIDHIIPFHESMPSELIAAIRPDVFVKGGNYTTEDIPERSIVKKYKGEIKILRFHTGKKQTGSRPEMLHSQISKFPISPFLL